MRKRCVNIGLLWVAGITMILAGTPGIAQKSEFSNWPAGKSPREIGKRIAANLVARTHPIDKPSVHYAEDSTWYASLRFASLSKDKDLKISLIRKFDPILTSDGRKSISMTRHVDHAVFGIVPLELYIQTKEPKYLELGKMLADQQWEKPDQDGLSDQTRFWIDDMYMITMLQLQAYRATRQKTYLERAALEMVAYLDKLQQPNGLFYHGPAFPFFWGRGNGWVAGGMAELLSDLPVTHPRRVRILGCYLKMMDSLLKFQDADGMWHQLIDHPESYKETSCTAMFTFAMITGVKKGWLKDPAYAQAARKGWLALTTYIDAEGNIGEVCVGTGQTNSLEFYLNRPRSKGDFHGQAPLVWCAMALLK
jgi:unsaturated rhamnogalacturonyl hydrolase